MAKVLFDHEQAWWERTAAQQTWGITDLATPIPARVMVALPLLNTSDEAAVAAVIKRVPELASASDERLRNIPRWAAALYPANGPDGLRVAPDLLTDWFLTDHLANNAELRIAMLSDLTDDQMGASSRCWPGCPRPIHSPETCSSRSWVVIQSDGAEFLAGTAGDLVALANSGRLAAYAGLAPIPADSGRRTGIMHRPKRHHRGLRRVFYMVTMANLRIDGPSRAYYQRKRTERKGHNQALIALARRLVDVLWVLLRDNRPFELTPPNALTA